jgi:hypothetical protein
MVAPASPTLLGVPKLICSKEAVEFIEWPLRLRRRFGAFRSLSAAKRPLDSFNGRSGFADAPGEPKLMGRLKKPAICQVPPMAA